MIGTEAFAALKGEFWLQGPFLIERGRAEDGKRTEFKNEEKELFNDLNSFKNSLL